MTAKKLGSYFIRYIFVFLILSLYILEPMSVSASSSNTLRGLRQELAELKEQKKKK